MKVHHFKIQVNCFIPDNTSDSDKLQDREEVYDDYGLIFLPDSYSENGRATRLVINCHGAGGTITTDDSQTEHQVLTQYLVANGYAVMDVNGLPEEYAKKSDIDLRNNVGSPIAVRSYVKAYHYCMEHFNLKPAVFVHGGSMGGISSTNLVLCGCIPVIAHSAFCPVLDAYNEIFLHPWGNGLPKYAMGKIYGFRTDDNGELVYDEEKLCGYNPVIGVKSARYPVPVKFWHCKDDPIVSYDVTKRFIDDIRKRGSIAILRTLPYGGHEPQLVGDPIKAPSGIDEFCGEKLAITPAIEEAFVWIRIFDY